MRKLKGKAGAVGKTTGAAGSRKRVVACSAALLVLSSVVYVHTVGYGFLQWDDMTHIVRDEYAQGLSLQHSTRVFLPLETADYQPVRYLYHQVLYSLFGPDNAAACHAGNVLLKALMTLVAFLVLRRIAATCYHREELLFPFFGALLFSLHPMTVEPTAWCIGVKDLLAGLFYLAAMHSFLRYLELGRRRLLVLTGAFFVLALLSKVAAISFPFVAAILLWYREGKPGLKRMAVALGPLVVLAIVVAALNVAAYSQTQVIGDRSFQDRLENVGSIVQSSVPVYALNLLLPVFNSPVYDQYRGGGITDARFVGSWLAVAALVVLAVWLVRRRQEVGLFVAYFLLSAMPAFAFQTYVLTADRYIFLATLPASAALAWLLFRPGRTSRARRVAIVVAAVICVGYGAATVSYSQCFRDDQALFARAVKIAPRNPTACNNYASTLRAEGATAEAVRYFRRAAELDPGHFRSRRALGEIYSRTGDFREAERYLREALAIDPGSAEINWRLGRVMLELGDPDEALRFFDRAIVLDAGAEDAFYLRGMIEFGREQYDAAERDFTRAREINPGRADTYSCLGMIALEGRADHLGARALFEKAAELAPASPDPRYRIGLSYLREYKLVEARAQFQRAFDLDPDGPLQAAIRAQLDQIDRELVEQ